jgi:hypothetical protein
MNTREFREDYIDYLDDFLLDDRGLLKVVSAHILHAFPILHLLQWANQRGVFHFITSEMIQWLKAEIGDRKAIEICAGHGTISRALGIIGIDSRVHESKKFRELLKDKYGPAADSWAVTHAPRDIKKYEASEAVRIFRPQVVVGAFVSQKGKDYDSRRGNISFEYGVNEREIVKKVETYIHFGNKSTHAGKFIYDLPHEELSFPWLVNRAFDQSLNRVWIWRNS